MAETLGQVVTFYSYKGGVGRTFALADVAVSLARWGYRVLCMDWDLEAPGLDYYFDEFRKAPASEGLLDWIDAYARGAPRGWQDLVETLELPPDGAQLHFLSAGNRGERYASRVQGLSWPDLYERGFGACIEEARAQWTRAYDFVLVDSRTGLSDVGGICTIQLPDTLVALFTPNQQSLDGALRVARSAMAAQRKQPIDRAEMRVVPVVTRVETNEYEQYRMWMSRVAEASAPFIHAWGDPDEERPDAGAVMQRLAVPQVLYWAYGERLAALRDDPNDPRSVRYAHDALAALLAHGFGRLRDFVKHRDGYVAEADRDEHIGGRIHADLSDVHIQRLTSLLLKVTGSRKRLARFAMSVVGAEHVDTALPLGELARSLIDEVERAGLRDEFFDAARRELPAGDLFSSLEDEISERSKAS
jgi:cellulose biosynthesis protein BcsQ